MTTMGSTDRARPSRPWRIAVYSTVMICVLFILGRCVNFDVFTMSTRKDPWLMMTCDRYVRASAESPDHAWKAVMVDFACGAFGGAGVFTTVAVVEMGDEPLEKDDVLGAAEIYGKYRDITKLEWQSEKLLQITLPQGTQLYDLKTIHNDIAIEIKYVQGSPT